MSKAIKVLPSASAYALASRVYDKKEKYLNSFERGKFIAACGEVRGKKVLDVGAGTGRISRLLAAAGAQVTALDVSPEMLAVLSKKSKNKITTAVGDAENLPFPEASFDLVTAAFLIVHFKDPKIFFSEAYRVLADGGRLVVSNINQKEAPVVETARGPIKIVSYYHRPEKIRELAEELAFGIENEMFVREGETWVNQILVLRK